ncbi:MAG: hypothetical protein ACLFQ6_09065 [Candidatus Sumerlaeia bacterium]
MKCFSKYSILSLLLLVCAIGTGYAATNRYRSERFVLTGENISEKELKHWAEVCEKALDPLLPEDFRMKVMPIRVVVTDNQGDFEKASTMRGESILAVAQTGESRMILNGARLNQVTAFEQYQTIRHELVHLILGSLDTGDAFVPQWLHEGLAQLIPKDSSRQGNVKLAWASLLNRRIPMNHLALSFPYGGANASLAYAQSASFTEFVAKKGYSFDSVEHFFAILIENDAQTRAILADLSDPAKVLALEDAWKQEAGNFTHLLLVIGSQSFLWGGIVLLFVGAYLYKRRKEKAVMQEWDPWEREEDEDDRRPYDPSEDGW